MSITLLESVSPAFLERLERAHSPHTIRAWRQDSKRFATYCRQCGTKSFPASPATVADFLEDTELKVSSLRRILRTLSKLHQLAGLPDPTQDHQVKLTIQGLAREKGTRQNQARGLTWSLLKTALTALDDQIDLRAARDAALASMAYETMARRGELVAIQVGVVTG